MINTMMIMIIHREQATKTKKMIIHLNREQHIDIGIAIPMILNMIAEVIEIENDRPINVDITRMIDQHQLMNDGHIQMDENLLIRRQEQNVNTMIVEHRRR